MGERGTINCLKKQYSEPARVGNGFFIPVPAVLCNGSVLDLHGEPIDLEYLHAVEGTLGEWAGTADEEAYRGL